MTSRLFEECLDAVSVLANWNEVLGKVQHCYYMAQCCFLENMGVQQEKQLSISGTKFNTALSGTHYQASVFKSRVSVVDTAASPPT